MATNTTGRAAGKPTRVDLDNRVVAAARTAGRFAARRGLPATSCPYRGDDPATAALRRVWVTAYLRARPPAKAAIDHGGQA